jgi:hypothetical protein
MAALEDLYAIMNDKTAGIPARLRAGVAASRTERLAMPGEEEPPAVVFLRSIVNCEHPGLMFHHNYRTAAAEALAYWERRCKRAELQYDVPDDTELRTKWRRILNGLIRAHLVTTQRWPRDEYFLIAADEPFTMPAGDPDTTLAALLLGGQNRHAKRRQKAIDQPVASGMWSGSEEQRLALIRPLAELVRQRIYGGSVGSRMGRLPGPHQKSRVYAA